MNTVKHISSVDFNNERLKYLDLTILECYNENNAILNTMELVIKKLKDSIPIKFKHLRIETTKNPFVVDTFYVQKNPSYLIFFNGNFIDRLDGIVSFDVFSKRIYHNIIKYKMDIN